MMTNEIVETTWPDGEGPVRQEALPVDETFIVDV
jgi:hypothetical protein